MKKADADDNNDDTHQGWIIVRDGMYSVADKKVYAAHADWKYSRRLMKLKAANLVWAGAIKKNEIIYF